VTVIGANGVMGTNIAGVFASFGNAKVYMVSRDIEKSKQAAQKAAKSVRAGSIAKNLIPADYSELEACVADSDLVFESAAENLAVKLEVTKRIAAALGEKAIACSGTSGLSITTLAECFAPEDRPRYFGVHLFNPPYNMPLCELIPSPYSDAALLQEFKEYLQTVLFRTVVEVKDAPAFLANRIGFQFINEAMQYAERYQDSGGIDYIDAILGTFTGRSMAPLTTADFVGLDVHKAIVDNVYTNTKDYANDTFVLPTFAQELIDQGLLGRKSGGGLYKAELQADGKRRILVYDIGTKTYRDKIVYAFPFAKSMKACLASGDYEQAFEALLHNHSTEAEICLHFLLTYIVYALVTASQVGETRCAADDVMATGFNWCPPIAMIDAFSTVTDVKKLVVERLDPAVLSQIDVDELFKDMPRSTYDYRSYFKSAN
ncbi:MAG: 3-hydroxyacyl-CoA dehydrogenase family protein, partial [Clostridia bacterium]|nr:3-hydroxyacyl-CoA dehydrogenase family protein [Clostridia bacterium]